MYVNYMKMYVCTYVLTNICMNEYEKYKNVCMYVCTHLTDTQSCNDVFKLFQNNYAWKGSRPDIQKKKLSTLYVRMEYVCMYVCIT